jgi:hypothetical protein
MTNQEMKQSLDDFATRLRLLALDFDRLMDDFGAYEDESSCAHCGEREGLVEDCEYCCAQFCSGCLAKGRELAEARKKNP